MSAKNGEYLTGNVSFSEKIRQKILLMITTAYMTKKNMRGLEVEISTNLEVADEAFAEQ